MVTPTRQPFNEETIERSIRFAKDLLTLIPELEGVAIVPSWVVTQDRLPFGVVVGRNGQLSNPMELMHMATQLHGTLQNQLARYVEVLKAFDTRAAEIVKELNDKRQELAALEAQLATAEGTGSDPGSGAAPEGTGESGDQGVGPAPGG